MASSRNEKLHRTVLNRCLPTFVLDLNFMAVCDYLSQKNILDDITLRDILEEKTTSDKVRQLIYRLQQRDQHTYEKFKDCLVLSKQEHLKQLLEEEEGNVAAEKDKTQGKARGAPKYSSAKPIHHSRSSNAVLEGTGVKYNNTSNLISPRSSESLQGIEYVLKEHFDACITYCEDDETDAYEFKDHLETLDLGLGEHPKICLYTEEKVWGSTKLTEKVKFVSKHCTLIFVYLSKRSSLDEYADFFRNEVIMATIKNRRVRPVLSEKDCIIPTGLNDAPRIELYKRELRSYKENILSLFRINKPERLRREAEGIESILFTL